MKEWYKIKGQHLKNIANKMRGYLGTTDAIAPEEMDAKVDEVYNKRWHEQWDKMQQNGNRVNYTYAFGGHTWDDENFKPKYDMNPTDALGMFIVCQIRDLRKSAIGVDIDFSKSKRLTNIFSYAATKYVGVISTIGSTSSDLSGMFGNSGIVSIDEFILKSDGSQSLTNIFQSCPNLEHVIVSGVIGKNGFNVSASPKLDLESLLSILNALADKSGDTSGTSWVCTLGTDNLAKLSDEQKQIATDKGWNLV